MRNSRTRCQNLNYLQDVSFQGRSVCVIIPTALRPFPLSSRSYRFPRVFVDPDGVRRMQSQLEKVIGAAVASNLTLRQVPTSAEVADGSSSTQDYDDAEWQENLEDRDGMWKRIQEELGASGEGCGVFCLLKTVALPPRRRCHELMQTPVGLGFILVIWVLVVIDCQKTKCPLLCGV